MNYTLIKDEDKFREFINWLPDLEDGEQYYVALFCRSKYDTTGTLKSDKSQLGRTVTTKDRLFGKVKKMEVELGTYEIGGVPIPEDTMALYIHPNPRSMKKASIKTAKMILDNIDKDRYQNPKSIALNAIQTSKSRSVYVDFDFDVANRHHYDKYIRDIAYEATGNTDCFKVIKTKGGYHILVRPDLTIEKRWYQNMTANKNIDQKGDLLLPVPGCVQGNHIPHFI